MVVIAKTTNGFIIEASEKEVAAVLSSCNNTAIKDVSIGTKIPAIDYSEAISNVKNITQSFDYMNLVETVKNLTVKVNSFANAAAAFQDLK